MNLRKTKLEEDLRLCSSCSIVLSIILIWTLAANHTMAQTMQQGNFTSNSFNQTLLPPINISPQNVSLYQDSIGITHIVGMITNPFTFPIRSVQVTASAHNAQNQLISTG